jgi:hypothetical protein
MSLEEIFEGEEHLLESEAVQKLIEQAHNVVQKNARIAQRYQDCHDKILDVIMYSNRVLIRGMSDKEALDKIHEIIKET